jgi:hypothetical protein
LNYINRSTWVGPLRRKPLQGSETFVLSIIRLCGYDWFLKLAPGRTVMRLEAA